MTLLGPFDRQLSIRLAGSGVFPSRTPPVAGFERRSGRPIRARPSTRPDERRIEVARFLTWALLADSDPVVPHIARLEAAVDELVVVRAPSLSVASRTELVSAIFDRDDAITDIDVEITGEAIGGRRVYVEWQVTGRFHNAVFLNDDVLIEPSHTPVHAVGVFVFDFRSGSVSRVSCFYDGVALLEQLLIPDGSSVHPNGVMTPIAIASTVEPHRTDRHRGPAAESGEER